MTAQFTHGYALLIGVNESAIPNWALPDVAKDIAALAAALTHPERCAYAPDNVRILTGKEATKANILAGLAWLKEKLDADQSDNETALIYYSGHGFQDTSLAQPAYYLIPYDVSQTRLRQTALRADDFAAEINALNPRRLLALLDCCHAGGMGVKEVGEPASAGAPGLAPFILPPGWLLAGQKAVEITQEGKDIDANLLMQGQGRAVLNSSRSDEKSYIRSDRSMSIFTYHLIEALTGHAPHAAEDKEVTAADLLSYTWRKVPQSAEAQYQEAQHPDGQISGNFSIALLLGGTGTPPGKALPDPLEPLPAAKEAQSRSVFDQRGQTVEGPQTNIAGDVNGPVLSGKFKAPVNVGSGTQISVGDIKTSGGTVNISGRDIIQTSTVTQTSGVDPQAIAKAFATIMKQVDQLADEEQEDARDAVEKLKKEAEKGEQANESRVRKWLDFLASMSGDVFEVAMATFTNPLSGLSTAFRKIAERAKEEREAKGKA